MSVHPFDSDPVSVDRYRWGRLTIHATPVILQKDAFYTVDDPQLVDRDGMPLTFRGKKKVPPEEASDWHVVLVLHAKNREGIPYAVQINFLYRKSDPVCQATLPSLREHFGKSLERLRSTPQYVRLIETTVDDRGFERRVWKVDTVYASEEEMNAAIAVPTDEIDEAMIQKIHGLVQALGTKAARSIIESNPAEFGGFSADELFVAAGI